MSKASERYNIKVEIPICIILDTIFNSYNNDVELLCRQALKYGFIDFDDKTKEYVLQKDYKEQDLYTVLDKEERKQYDLENELRKRIDKAIEYINKRMVHEGEYWVRKAFHFRNTEYGKDLLEILGDKE